VPSRFVTVDGTRVMSAANIEVLSDWLATARCGFLAYAPSNAFYDTTLFWQWMRMPGDVLFALGALLMAWDFIAKLGPFVPPLAERLQPEPAPSLLPREDR
jgi:cbb3-type cytochrome oxidase subunit 1